MTLTYACFISYPRDRLKATERYADEFYGRLCDALGLMLDKDVYLDRKVNEGGDLYNDIVAQALCQSICMVLLFTPVYLEHQYCIREYKAMQKLESERLKLLGPAAARGKGLIIPVVCAGLKYLPKDMKDKREYFDFEKYTLLEGTPRQRKADIAKIASYIRDRYEELKALPASVFNDCEYFQLPEEKEVRPWMEGNPAPPAMLPGREPGK